MTAILQRVELPGALVGWHHPPLTEAGITNIIGEARPGVDGRDQWGTGVRYNFDVSAYAEDEQHVVAAVNGHGHAMTQLWAVAAGLRAVARPLKSRESKAPEAVIPESAHVRGDEFRLDRARDGLWVATTKEPTDFVMVTRNDAPEKAGVMFGVADSVTVTLGDKEGRAVGVVHGSRDAIIGGIGNK